MIKSFRHKALRKFWETSSTKGLNANWIGRIERILDALDLAQSPEDTNIPSFGFHSLSGDKAGRYSVTVSANWRITFAFEQTDAVNIDLEDYH